MVARPIGWIDHDLVCLFVGRLLRSFSQAYLVIIVPLYLARLGYDAIHLGVLFSIAAAAGAILAAAIGFLSDRIGRKPLLITISLMTGAAGGIFATSTGFAVLTAAAALGTIGRGGGAAGGGGYGPFYPAEQALIAEHAKDADRTTVFAALSLVGLVGGTIGSLVAWLPDLLRQHGLPLLQGYRVLFAFTVLVGLGMAAAVLPVREAGLNRASDHQILSMYTKHGGARSDRRWRLGLSPVAWNLICRFMLTNATNGLAGGMLGPLLVYWFHRRYGVEATQIGQLYFAINLLAAIADVTASGITARIGTVRTVAISRALAALLLGAMVLMPMFWMAGLLYALRMIAVSLSVPVRQSYLMGVISETERSRAAGLASFPSQLGGSFGPYLGGYMMQHIELGLPLEAAALLQAISAVLFYFFFQSIRPPEETATISIQARSFDASSAHG